jgi:hypothetical protein
MLTLLFQLGSFHDGSDIAEGVSANYVLSLDRICKIRKVKVIWLTQRNLMKL